MSDQNDPKDANKASKLSLRRETVKALGVKSSVKTGRACDGDSLFSCLHSGPCTHTIPPTIAFH